MKKKLWLTALLMGYFTLPHCASTPKPDTSEFSDNISADIDRIQQDLDQRYARQNNVLAPESYRKAKEQLDAAKSARDKNKSLETQREHAGLAVAWLKKNDQTAEKARKEFAEVLEARAYALKVGAPEHAKKELSAADDRLEKLTGEFEQGDEVRVNVDAQTKLLTLYQDAAKESLKSKHLASARSTYNQAVKEGAKTLLPSTAAKVEKKLREDEIFVEANFRDETQIASQALQTQAKADRLLSLTKDAKQNKGKSVEELTLEAEKAESELAAAETTAEKVEQQAMATEKQLSERERYDRAFQLARQSFTPDEAEVLREGDNVILRLKGLHFKQGKSDLSSDDIALLNRVNTVLSAYEPGKIVVQGHTDATGSQKLNKKLSQNRAEVVKTYLEGLIPQDQEVNLQSTGLGSEKPVANNATVQGRAQNRRVDLILSSKGSASPAAAF